MSFTLTEMLSKVRQRANMENSTFVTDSEITGYINASYSELYDILVSRFEDYFSKELSFTLVNESSKTLPTDFYKARGLDILVAGSDYETCRRWNFEERNNVDRARTRLLDGVNDRLYRVMGSKLMILPQDKGPGSYKLWYIPRFTPLKYSSDCLGDVLDFEEYIVVDAAMKCLIKEESDINELMVIKNMLIARIKSMASNRDTQAERISDVRSTNDFAMWPRGY